MNVVLKCGGSTLSALPDTFFADLKHMLDAGVTPVIVHGGGPAISRTLERLGIETEFVGGLRKTTEQVLDVVEMVLAGQINKEIVRRLQQAGVRALGLSGTDGRLLVARPVANAAEIGHVGEVVAVNAELIRGIIAMGYVPVIAPVAIGEGEDGQRYNINADTAAGAVAAHLGTDRLIVVTDVPGIMRNGRVMPAATQAEIENMIATGEIYGGMIPKVRAAMYGLKGGVKEVVIVDGKERHGLPRVLRGEPVGTRICP